MDLLRLNHGLGAQVHRLEEAAHRNARIAIATGLVMAQHQIGADGALAVLRGASQDSNRKLGDLAEDVISWKRLLPVSVRGRRRGHRADTPDVEDALV